MPKQEPELRHTKDDIDMPALRVALVIFAALVFVGAIVFTILNNPMPDLPSMP